MESKTSSDKVLTSILQCRLKAITEEMGYTLLRTDRNGWIQLSTDGEQLWVEVERD